MVLGFSLAAPLGPVNMEMIKQTLSSRTGWILGILTGVGAMSADFLIASAVLFFGSGVLESIFQNKVVFASLSLFNFALLTYIGLSALHSDINDEESADDVTITVDEIDGKVVEPGFSRKISLQLATGFGIVVSSPWSYLWWISFGGFILGQGESIPLNTTFQRVQVTFFFIAGIATWVILFCGVLTISHKIASPRLLRLITQGSAILIIILAVSILNDAICKLFNIGICSFSL